MHLGYANAHATEVIKWKSDNSNDYSIIDRICPCHELQAKSLNLQNVTKFLHSNKCRRSFWYKIDRVIQTLIIPIINYYVVYTLPFICNKRPLTDCQNRFHWLVKIDYNLQRSHTQFSLLWSSQTATAIECHHMCFNLSKH